MLLLTAHKLAIQSQTFCDLTIEMFMALLPTVI